MYGVLLEDYQKIIRFVKQIKIKLSSMGGHLADVHLEMSSARMFKQATWYCTV